MIEAEYTQDLHLLKNALRNEGFRFILIGHNRHSLYTDLAAWLRTTFPDRKIEELRFSGKDYRQITDTLKDIGAGIVLIPDFDALFREENTAIRQAFNQRRDYFAAMPLALICFIQPANFRRIPSQLPDWWSIRSLEMDWKREAPDWVGEWLLPETEISTLGGDTREEKEAEISRLLRQLELAEPDNLTLFQDLTYQLGILNFKLANYDQALAYMNKLLEVNRKTRNLTGEMATLNSLGEIHLELSDYNKSFEFLQKSLRVGQVIDLPTEKAKTLTLIGQVWFEKGDHTAAMDFFSQSLLIQQKTGYKKGEWTTLNNISQIYEADSNYEAALIYLERALEISKEIDDWEGIRTILGNIGHICFEKGDYDLALSYMKQSLRISEEIGDRKSEGIILNNIGSLFSAKGDLDNALNYLEKSLRIKREIGDSFGMAATLNNIGAILFKEKSKPEVAIPLIIQSIAICNQIGSEKARVSEGLLAEIKHQIGEARFQEIVAQIKPEPM